MNNQVSNSISIEAITQALGQKELELIQLREAVQNLGKALAKTREEIEALKAELELCDGDARDYS